MNFAGSENVRVRGAPATTPLEAKATVNPFQRRVVGVVEVCVCVCLRLCLSASVCVACALCMLCVCWGCSHLRPARSRDGPRLFPSLLQVIDDTKGWALACRWVVLASQ